MRHATLFILVLTALTLAACRGKDKTPALNFGQETYDPEALHLALVTNAEALPIIYAERTGLYDTLGLKVQLAIYHDQPDCDTALLGHYADGGMADLTRLATYGRRAAGLRTLWTGGMGSRRALYVAGALRVKTPKALKGRTVGVSPRTADDVALTEALRANGLGAGDVYRPQIADLRYREAMITGNQIDATILVWPYTSLAQADGNHLIYTQRHPDGQMAFVARQSAHGQAATAQRNAGKGNVGKGNAPRPATARQWQLFERGRQMALDSLRRSPRSRARLSLILQRDYGLPRAVADTITLPF